MSGKPSPQEFLPCWVPKLSGGSGWGCNRRLPDRERLRQEVGRVAHGWEPTGLPDQQALPAGGRTHRTATIALGTVRDFEDSPSHCPQAEPLTAPRDAQGRILAGGSLRFLRLERVGRIRRPRPRERPVLPRGLGGAPSETALGGLTGDWAS